MDYATFVARRSAEWQELESLLRRTGARGLRRLAYDDLERLAALHRRAASDFALARERFPRTEIEGRLRQLVFAGHRALSSSHEPLLLRIVRFYRHGFPRIFRERLPTIAFTCAVFLAATLAGYAITAVQPGLVGLFLGPNAIEGVRNGEIWTDSVSQAAPPSVLSSQIATNNAGVALMAWAGGALLGALTAYVIVLNGIMFGSVVALTVNYGLFDRLLAFVSAHGPLELFLITVAAAAGFELTRGQLAFDPRPRRVAFREAGRRSVRLMLGILPWFFVLGLIEGFVSPQMDLPTSAKVVLGILVLATFLAYALGAFSRRPAPEAS